jgi:hypothetical protein
MGVVPSGMPAAPDHPAVRHPGARLPWRLAADVQMPLGSFRGLATRVAAGFHQPGTRVVNNLQLGQR